jgi:hypothetical protein
MFLANSPLIMMCVPDLEAEGAAGTELRRPYFGMHRMEWSDTPGVEFHLPHGEMIRLLHESGFEIDDLVELRPGPDATTRYDELATLDWARKWPSEEVWKARKR